MLAYIYICLCWSCVYAYIVSLCLCLYACDCVYRRIISSMYLKLLIKVWPVFGKGVQGVSHQVYYCLVFAYFDIMS